MDGGLVMDPSLMSSSSSPRNSGMVELNISPVESPGNNRRSSRRRKTLSPSSVLTSLRGVEIQEGDPLDFPDPPDCGKREEEGGNDVSMTHEEEGSLFATEKDVANLLETPGKGVQSAVVDRYSPPMSPLVSSSVGPIPYSHARVDERVAATAAAVTPKSLRKKGSFEPRPPLSQITNRGPSASTSATKSGAKIVAPKVMPEKVPIAAKRASPSPKRHAAAGGKTPLGGGVGVVAGGYESAGKQQRKKRRQSLVMPPKMSALEDDADSNNVTVKAKTPQKVTKPTKPVISSRHTSSTTISKVSAPAPRPVATATGCFRVPMARAEGYTPTAEDDIRVLCREFVAEEAGSQRSRRLSARIYYLTGYPLTAMAARDADALRTAAGAGVNWAVESSVPPIVLDGEVEYASDMAKRRALFKRLLPVLENMEKRGAEEKEACFSSTGLTVHKVDDSYEYRENGHVVSPSVYRSRYLTYVEDVKRKRQRRFAEVLPAPKFSPSTAFEPLTTSTPNEKTATSSPFTSTAVLPISSQSPPPTLDLESVSGGADTSSHANVTSSVEIVTVESQPVDVGVHVEVSTSEFVDDRRQGSDSSTEIDESPSPPLSQNTYASDISTTSNLATQPLVDVDVYVASASVVAVEERTDATLEVETKLCNTDKSDTQSSSYSKDSAMSVVEVSLVSADTVAAAEQARKEAIARAESRLWEMWEAALETYHSAVDRADAELYAAVGGRETHSNNTSSVEHVVSREHVESVPLLEEGETEQNVHTHTHVESVLGGVDITHTANAHAKLSIAAAGEQTQEEESTVERVVGGGGAGGTCELCWDSLAFCMFDPCGHHVCAQCSVKLLHKREQTGVPLFCPWDRRPIVRILEEKQLCLSE